MNIEQVAIPRTNWGGEGTNQLKVIVMHWIVGELAACDATFKNPDRKASSHYAVGSTGEVHQYVQDHNVAWHAGPTVNYMSIGIEHAGGQTLSDGNKKKPTQVCHDTSAQLVADLCRKYNIPCDADHIKRHKQYMSTECPGTLDVEYIISKANSIINGTPMEPFNYELYVNNNDLYMRVLSGSINENCTVKNLTAGTSWQVFCNKSPGNDGGPINTGMQDALYEVVAKGVTKQYDNRTPVVPEPPVIVITCEIELKAAKARISELLNNDESNKIIINNMSGIISVLKTELVEKDQEIRTIMATTSGYGAWEKFINWIKNLFIKK